MPVIPSVPIRVGQKFGRLTVLSLLNTHTRCQCDCGNTHTVRNDRLRSGKTQSCGCILKEMNAAARKPPLPPKVKPPKRTANERRLAAVYHAMIRRCTCPEDPAYRYYGGRGVGVCRRWAGSIDAFLQDMLPTYKHGLWLERIDNDLGYSPDNCEFRTPFKQSCNRRNTLTFPNGVVFPTWCRHHRLDYQRAYSAFTRLQATLGHTPTQAEVLDALG